MMRRAESTDALNAECRQPSFKANPIPKSCTVLLYKQTVEKQEQDRKKRIHEQAEMSYAKASMPSRMQKAANREKEKPSKTLQAEQYPFQPKINEAVTAEMFKTMQRKFEAKLNRKKSQMAVTRPKSPDFQKQKQRPLQRDYVNEAPPTIDKPPSMTPKAVPSKHALPYEKVVKQPSKTRAMELSQKKRRDEIVDAQRKELLRKQEDEKRAQKQQQLKPVMQPVFE